jgi:hypothetical protein
MRIKKRQGETNWDTGKERELNFFCHKWRGNQYRSNSH